MNDILFRDYWDKVQEKISDLLCDAENFEAFGNAGGSLDSFDRMNEFWYLFNYAHLAWYEQELRIKNLYPTSPTDCPDTLSVRREIWDEFNFGCIRDYFLCRHKIDILDLLKPFKIMTDMGEGIDFMRIENNDNCVPPFKIV